MRDCNSYSESSKPVSGTTHVNGVSISLVVTRNDCEVMRPEEGRIGGHLGLDKHRGETENSENDP